MDIKAADVNFNNPFLPPIWREPITGARSWFGLSYAHQRGFRPMVLDLHVPVEADGPVPCVIYIHGGGFEAGDRRHLPENWEQNGIFEQLVAAGLAVATVDYRLMAEAGPVAELHDCAAAVRYLRHFAADLGLDPNRFALWGESAGATLAALVAFLSRTDQHGLLGQLGAADTSSAVSAVVLYYPPTDMVKMVAQMPDVLPMAAIPQAELAAFSPLSYVHPQIPPTLIVHGDADQTVPHAQGVELHNALLAAGVSSKLQTIPGADHCFRGVAVDPILDETVSWLAEIL